MDENEIFPSRWAKDRAKKLRADKIQFALLIVLEIVMFWVLAYIWLL